MRIAVVMPGQVDRERKGYHARSLSFVTSLAERNDVRVLTPAHLDDERGSSRAGRLRAVLEALMSGWPLQVGLFDDRKAAHAIAMAAQEWGADVALVVTERLPWSAGALCDTHIPIVLDAVDALELAMRERAAIEGPVASLVLQSEARAFHRLSTIWQDVASTVVVCAERERRAYPKAVIVPSGIGHERGHERGKTQTDRIYDLTFTGTLSYWANQQAVAEFCEQIVPLVRQHLPNLRAVVAGHSPPRSARALCRRAQVELFSDPSDLSVILAASRLAVAPLHRATGMQLKVGEALSVGTPVLAYPAVCAGLPGSIQGVVECIDAAALAAHAVAHLNGQRPLQVLIPSELGWEARARELEAVLRQAADL